MPAYIKKFTAVCGDCSHFCQHYFQNTAYAPPRYTPLSFGHCTFPRVKVRSVDQTCPHWSPAGDEKTAPPEGETVS